MELQSWLLYHLVAVTDCNQVMQSATTLNGGSYPAGGTGSRARDLGLRAQKKLLGRVVSTGAGRSLLIDDATTSLLDNLYKLMERAAKTNSSLDKKQPEKVLKNIVKLSIKGTFMLELRQTMRTAMKAKRRNTFCSFIIAVFTLKQRAALRLTEDEQASRTKYYLFANIAVIRYLGQNVGLLQRNQQLNATDDAKLAEIRTALRSAAMSVVSFYELEFSFDKMYLTKSLERCRSAIHALIKPHLTDKSLDRCDQVFDFLTHSDFLDSVFRQDSELRPILGMLVSDINKALDAGHL